MCILKKKSEKYRKIKIILNILENISWLWQSLWYNKSCPWGKATKQQNVEQENKMLFESFEKTVDKEN